MPAGEVGAGLPALPRRDEPATGATPRRPGRRSPPTGSSAPATSAGSTTRGRLRLVGRSKEMYVRGGYNVYPVEVEAVLSTHPGVAAVAVVPRADDVMGEVGVAVVVPRDPAAPPTLDDAARRSPPADSPATSSPRTCVVVDDAPAHRDGEGRPAGAASRPARRPANLTPAVMELEFTADQDELRDAVRAVLAARVPDEPRARGRREGRSPTDAPVEADGRARLARAHGARGSTAASGSAWSSSRSSLEELGRVDRARAVPRRPSPSSCPRCSEAGSAAQQAALPRARSPPGSAPARSRSPRPGAARPGRRRRPPRRRRRLGSRGVKHAVFDAAPPTRSSVVARRRRAPTATTGSARSSCRAAPSRRRRSPRSTRSRRLAHASMLDGVTVAADRVLGEPGPATATRGRAGARGGHRRARARDASAPARRSSTSPSTTPRSASSSACRSGRSRRSSTSFADMLDRARAGPRHRLLRRAHDRRGRRAAAHSPRRWPRPPPATAPRSLAKEGIQIHGGIGYTWEHDMHLYVRRGQVRRGRCSAAATEHRARIADLLGV